MKRNMQIIVTSLIVLFYISISNLNSFSLAPEVVGNSSMDSVIISFETFDTTALPAPVNVDSLKVLQFGPDGGLIDSLGEDGSGVTNLRVGSYEVRLRASDSTGAVGYYTVRVYAYYADQIRGAASQSYYVRQQNWASLDSIDFNLRAVLDTLNDGFASQVGQDTSVIARSVWDDDLVSLENRTVDFDLQGGGAYPCSLYVYDSTDSTALQGVSLRIMNADQTATVAARVSNQLGLAVFALDSGQYYIWSYKVGVTFEILPDTLDQTSSLSIDTIWGSGFDPGNPAAPELCRVYGWIYDISGLPVEGTVITARLIEDNIRYLDYIISPYYQTTESDSLGYWEMDLYSNQVLYPEDSQYEFLIYYDKGRVASERVSVPDQVSWQLSW